MREEKLNLGIPAVLYGEPSQRVVLFVHGAGGSKAEASAFAAMAPDRQVLGLDLPGHGERTDMERFDPWSAVPELQAVARYAMERFTAVALRANSIGAYFSLLAFKEIPLTQALLVSPICDMEDLIRGKMQLLRISEARLQAEQMIPAPDGIPLTWEYLSWVRAHPITRWATPTEILCGEFDNVVAYRTLRSFQERFGAGLTVMPDGEHWFHTPAELAFEESWTKQKLL